MWKSQENIINVSEYRAKEKKKNIMALKELCRWEKNLQLILMVLLLN